MLDTIKKLTSVFSVSGHEQKISKVIEDEIFPYVDTVENDAMGNLIAFKKGLDSSKRVMIAAHMDEIGFIVTFIDDNGFIRVHNMGGINPVACAFSRVKFENGTVGIIVPEGGTAPADLSVKKLIIDIGAKNKKEAEKKVQVGDVCALENAYTRLMNNKIAVKALDDRLGCAVAIEAAKLATTPKYDTYYVFTVQEEVGCRGSKTGAFAVAPTYGIAIDVTGTGDTIGAMPMAIKVGDGAAIKIKDSSVICSKKIVDRLTVLAKDAKIPYQYEVLEYGGTDTSSMQTAASGSYAGCVSIPTRYIHSAVETVSLSDVDACIKLIAEFVKNAD